VQAFTGQVIKMRCASPELKITWRTEHLTTNAGSSLILLLALKFGYQTIIRLTGGLLQIYATN
jgi:hypothetical protein